jgi:hypothetical protein
VVHRNTDVRSERAVAARLGLVIDRLIPGIRQGLRPDITREEYFPSVRPGTRHCREYAGKLADGVYARDLQAISWPELIARQLPHRRRR